MDMVAIYAKIAIPGTLKGVMVQENHFRERIRSRMLDLEKNRIKHSSWVPLSLHPRPFIHIRRHSFIRKHSHRLSHSRMMEYPIFKESAMRS